MEWVGLGIEPAVTVQSVIGNCSKQKRGKNATRKTSEENARLKENGDMVHDQLC